MIRRRSGASEMATTLYLRVNSVSRLKQLLKVSVRKASGQVQIVISGIKDSRMVDRMEA